MQNSNRTGVLLAIGFLILLPGAGQAVMAPEFPQSESLSPEQREALGALALADAQVRDAILEASLHPQKIEQIAAIAERSSAGFRARLDQVPRSKQKDIWELIRHPELIDALVLGGRPSRASTDAIVEPYPESVREIARRCVQYDFNLLDDIAHLREDAESETARVLASLPLENQASFEALIERPDILTTLAEHPELTAKLGDLYRVSPQRTRAILDRQHDELVEENERAITEWRESIEEDPEARDELVAAAERFAEEEEYEAPEAIAADSVTAQTAQTTQVHHYYHPYPYWFGPPYWHLAAHWYPDHAHWGFGFNLDGGMWIYGLPSPVFSYWYFGHPSHHGYYPRLYGHWSQVRAGQHRRRHVSHHQMHNSYRPGSVRSNDSHSQRHATGIERGSQRSEGFRVSRREQAPRKRADSPARQRPGVRERTVGAELRRQSSTRHPAVTGRRTQQEQFAKRNTQPSHHSNRRSVQPAIKPTIKKSGKTSRAIMRMGERSNPRGNRGGENPGGGRIARR